MKKSHALFVVGLSQLSGPTMRPTIGKIKSQIYPEQSAIITSLNKYIQLDKILYQRSKKIDYPKKGITTLTYVYLRLFFMWYL